MSLFEIMQYSVHHLKMDFLRIEHELTKYTKQHMQYDALRGTYKLIEKLINDSFPNQL